MDTDTTRHGTDILTRKFLENGGHDMLGDTLYIYKDKDKEKERENALKQSVPP